MSLLSSFSFSYSSYYSFSRAFNLLRECLHTVLCDKLLKDFGFCSVRSHGVMVSTLDSESSDPSSNLGGTSLSLFFFNLQFLSERTWHIFIPISFHFLPEFRVRIAVAVVVIPLFRR